MTHLMVMKGDIMKNTFVFKKTLSLFISAFSLFSINSNSAPIPFHKYETKPKLVVLLVIDQFRADYLTRYSSRFIPAMSKGKLGGFRYLLEKGAYYPFAEYGILQSMTCPGHAMIMTGTYPANTGIPLNDWMDQVEKEAIYCVDDKKDGASPRNLKTSTVSDEYLNIGHKSQILSVALKDRSAIMMGGHRANHVYWINSKKLEWETSNYYQTGDLPNWVKNQSEKINKSANKNDKNIFTTPVGIIWTMDLALAGLKNLSLGKSKETDFLLVSISTHDMIGHNFGPNSKEIEGAVFEEDKEISRLLNTLNKEIGLDKVQLVLTADHGVAHMVSDLKDTKQEAGFIDQSDLSKKLSDHLNKVYKLNDKTNWIRSIYSLNIYLDHKVVTDNKLNLEQVIQTARNFVALYPGVAEVVFSNQQFVSQEKMAAQIRRQYTPGKNGDLLIVPKPYFYQKGEAPANHITGYSYDTQVPLILLGARFRPGVYAEKVMVTDIAPTLAFLLGSINPVHSEGRVLHEAIE